MFWVDRLLVHFNLWDALFCFDFCFLWFYIDKSGKGGIERESCKKKRFASVCHSFDCTHSPVWRRPRTYSGHRRWTATITHPHLLLVVSAVGIYRLLVVDFCWLCDRRVVNSLCAQALASISRSTRCHIVHEDDASKTFVIFCPFSSSSFTPSLFSSQPD